MKRTLLTLLLTCAILLTGCEQGLFHAHEYAETETPPTCTEKGYTTYVCECGDSYTGNEVEATGHSYDAVVTEATCTEGGYTTYTCSVCQDTYKGNEVEATGHSYSKAVTIATCTNNGYTVYNCSVCKDTYTGDEVAAKGHSYEAVVTEATCTEGGYTTHTCACGDTYKDSETEAAGHSYSKSYVTAATCTSVGYTTYTCACGDNYTADYTEALDHNYDSGTVIAPTTEREGYTLYTCSRCGSEHKDNYTDKLPSETEQPETEVEQAKLWTGKWESGETWYCVGNCAFIDARTTWTSEVTAYPYNGRSLYVSWADKNGEIVELYIEPMEQYGYAIDYILNDDGTLSNQYWPLPDDFDANFG